MFNEVFMEEFSAIYYSALELKKEIIQFFSSFSREDAVIIKRRNKSNDREHTSAVSEELLSFLNGKE